MADLTLEIDMTGACIEPDALEQLRDCSHSHLLPAHVDPLQSDYRFLLAPLEDPTRAEAPVLAA